MLLKTPSKQSMILYSAARLGIESMVSVKTLPECLLV